MLLLLTACNAPLFDGISTRPGSDGDTPSVTDTDTPSPDTDDPDTAEPDTGPVSSGASCGGYLGDLGPYPSLDEFACASGEECAEEGEFIAGTCCVEGARLGPLSETRTTSEIVDVTIKDGIAVLCGGFGERVYDLSDPENPDALGSVVDRCQNSTLGPTINGRQLYYLTHHGDSWVESPTLTTAAITDSGVELLSDIEDTALLFEGLAWRDDHLYVAAGDDGVIVYQTGDEGIPTRAGSIEGLAGAAQIAVDGGRLYVTHEEWLAVFDLTEPAAPVPLDAIALPRRGQDLAVADGVAYVALGSGGLATVQTTGSALSDLQVLTTEGSIQAVAVEGDRVALAAWSHAQLRRASDLLLLGTVKTRPLMEYEQDFGVGLSGGRMVVGEWEGMHIYDEQPGHVSADVWTGVSAVSFWGDEESECDVELLNRGPVPLTIDEVTLPDGPVTLHAAAESIAPGEVGAVTLRYTPPAPEASTQILSIDSSDPDESRSPLSVPVYVGGSDRISVGDALPEAFAFLDPTGEDDLSNLEGRVIVLAYFALF